MWFWWAEFPVIVVDSFEDKLKKFELWSNRGKLYWKVCDTQLPKNDKSIPTCIILALD